MIFDMVYLSPLPVLAERVLVLDDRRASLLGWAWGRLTMEVLVSEQRRWIRGGIGVVAAGLALWLGLEYEEPSPALPGRTALPPIEKVEAEPARPSVTGQSLVVASGQTLQLEAARIPAGSPLVLELVVPVEAYADATLPVRILSEGREPLRLEASMSRNEGVRLEIPSDQLTPGRYLIEMKTPERSPLPLRRYVLEIN